MFSAPWIRASSMVGALVALAGCSRGSHSIAGSGHLATDTRAVAGFDTIELASVGTLDVAQTGSDSLTIQADDNLLPHLTSTVSGGHLTLGTDASIAPTKAVHYTLTVKSLAGVTVSGAGSVVGTNVDTSALTVRIEGAGSVKLSGRADHEDVTVSGAGGFDGAGLASRTAKVTLSGVGGGVVRVSDALDVAIDGLGKLEYIGDPKVTQKVDGLGTVTKRAAVSATP